MRSTMLSCEEKGWFHRTLLRKNLTRFSPLWAVYFAALFFSLAMPVINLDYRLMDSNGKGLREAQLLEEYRYLIRDGMETAVVLGVIFGCLFAMAFFSYLMNRRSVGMIHALPMRREGLFLTNVLSGVLCTVVPAVVVFFVALCAEWGKGAADVGDLALWLLVTVSATLFFFAFGTFCAMFTGSLLALPVFYGILNVLALGVEVLLQGVLEMLWVGYSTWDISTLTEWLTPVVFMYERVSDWTAEPLADGGYLHDLTAGALSASAYAIVFCLLFFLLALLVYRTRQMERAEDLVTVAWVRPIFRYGFGVCAGFALGEFLAGNFFDWGAWGLVALISLCAVLGAFVGQMLLKKTLRVLRSGWKGSLALGLCVLALLVGLRLDPTGYQTRVPAVEEVASVRVMNVWSMPYDGGASLNVTVSDPEQVARVTALHRWITEHLREVEEDTETVITDSAETLLSDSVGLRLRYTLKNGETLERRYSTVPVRENELTEEGSFAAMLTEFMEQPEVLWSGYLNDDFSAEVWTAIGATVNEFGTGAEFVLSAEKAERLWEAVREDINAGRYHRYLLATDAWEENLVDLQIDFDLYGMDDTERERYGRSFYIQVQRSATATMQVLEELGGFAESP